jgi:hypothetical protein
MPLRHFTLFSEIHKSINNSGCTTGDKDTKGHILCMFSLYEYHYAKTIMVGLYQLATSVGPQ